MNVTKCCVTYLLFMCNDFKNTQSRVFTVFGRFLCCSGRENKRPFSRKI